MKREREQHILPIYAQRRFPSSGRKTPTKHSWALLYERQPYRLFLIACSTVSGTVLVKTL